MKTRRGELHEQGHLAEAVTFSRELSKEKTGEINTQLFPIHWPSYTLLMSHIDQMHSQRTRTPLKQSR